MKNIIILFLLIVISSFIIILINYYNNDYYKKSKNEINKINEIDIFDSLLDNYSKFHINIDNVTNENIIIDDVWMPGGLNNKILAMVTTISIALYKWKLFYSIN